MVKKTRRHKKNIRKNKSTKSRINKLHGGATLEEEQELENNKLLKKIESEHSIKNLLPDVSLSDISLPDVSLGDSKILKEVTELSEGLAMHSINKTAEFFDLDLNNSDNFKQKLEEFKAFLNKPENKALMKELSTEFSKMGEIALEASSPFIDKLIKEIFEKLKLMGNEFGETGVSIALTTMTSIPVYGAIVGSIRSTSEIIKAGLAATNTASEIVTVSSDNLNAAVQNFEKLLNEKKEMESRIGGAINNFLNNSKSMPEKILGGSKINTEVKKNKTKKNVRFSI